MASEQSQEGQNAEDLYLESYAFTTAAAIVGSVDKRVCVTLRDGRNLFGILRTFDQFANLVLQDTVERIYLNNEAEGQPLTDHAKRFGEIYRGVFMIRGENVVMLGELDFDTEDDHLDALQQLPYDVAEREYKALQKERGVEERARAKELLSQGLIHEFVRY